MLAFLEHARQHYRQPDGKPGEQFAEFKRAVTPLHELYGHTLAREFGPLAQDGAQRAKKRGASHKTAGGHVRKVKRVFKWVTAEELVPATTDTVLATGEVLEAGAQQGTRP